jgi:hypothetical protein
MGFALSGLAGFLVPDSQGDALGYLIWPRCGNAGVITLHSPAPSGLL